MNPNCKYEVRTRWGWFRLDEGAYQDYPAGKLRICWEPGKNRSKPVEAVPPVNVGAEALRLRDKAEKDGVYRLLQQLYPGGQEILCSFMTACCEWLSTNEKAVFRQEAPEPQADACGDSASVIL